MISIVGAGPGAEDLITVRGMRLLQNADVIIYAGSLVNKELLNWAKDDCKIYNSAHMSLDEVIDVIKQANDHNLNAVRLHTGDPSIYGAIREQMDRMDNLGIKYEVIPGVSSFCAASAALKAEYTLPGVSQSVIITRLEGRTKVPELEKISEFAKHKSTMVIFLSASMTDLVAAQLIEGGYKEDTPAAIVYKASWPEQKVIRCTVGTLHKCAIDNDINNLALITVGYFLGDDYELSKLYDSGFSTGIRAATEKERIKASIISFSDKGRILGDKIKNLLDNRNYKDEFEIEITDSYKCESGKLHSWTANHFRKDDALVFIGACGIATRAIAPYVTHKTIDPAVIVIDEMAQNVIPLLSGHIGGANKISKILAELLDANACLSTATDINGVWAVDSWAVKHNMTIKNPDGIKSVSSKSLKGETVNICSDVVLFDYPETVEINNGNEPDLYVTYKKLDTDKLILIPRVLCVGIGCKRDTSFEQIDELWKKICSLHNIDNEAVAGVYSIDLKANEKGLIDFVGKYGFEFTTYSSDELNELSAEYSESEFVKNITGVDCICERSADKGAGAANGSKIIVKKVAENGVTIAIALKEISNE